jgi:hypothetical protein
MKSIYELAIEQIIKEATKDASSVLYEANINVSESIYS